MRDALHAYGLFTGFGIFAIAAWTTAASLSGGALPGGNGAAASVMGPLAIACFIMAIHCLIRLASKDTDA